MAAQADKQVFRLHLNTEPSSLKPWEQRNSSAGYLFYQISGTLLKYRDGHLIPSLAKSCTFKSKKTIDCEISRSATFSDGSPITPESFRSAWLEFLSPLNHSFHAELLFPIKNAEKYFAGKCKAADVGIKTQGAHLLIQLENEDPEFLFTFINPLLAPQHDLQWPELTKASTLVTSGSYVILSWNPQKKIILQNRKNKNIFVEFVFVSEDSTALNLYEKGELSFLRRLPTLFIGKYQGRSDFFQISQNRLDYIGFGPDLKSEPLLRQALAQSLDFDEIQKLLFSKGQYGCPGIAADLQDQVSCLKFDLKKSKEALKLYLKDKKPLPKLVFAFSKQGGDDHKMVAEWLQAQWKKNLDLDVEVRSIENKLFLEQLKRSPPSLFRKGVNPERPTCLAAIEIFDINSRENFLRLSPATEKTFFAAMSQLKNHPSAQKKKELCSQVTSALNQDFLWIPTGPIHFTVLAKPEWTNWNLNELNQLDLSDLNQISK